MILDSISVYFSNAATDALGYEHVEGKLYCGRDTVELHFKERDRAFKKSDPETVEFDYKEIEKVVFLGGWFNPKMLEESSFRFRKNRSPTRRRSPRSSITNTPKPI